MTKKVFFNLLMFLVLGSCTSYHKGEPKPPIIEYSFSADGGSTTFDTAIGITFLDFTCANGNPLFEIPVEEVPVVTYEIREHNLRHITEVIGSWFEINHYRSPMMVTVQPNLSRKERWIEIQIGSVGSADIRITQSAD